MAGSSKSGWGLVLVVQNELNETISPGPVSKGVKIYQFKIRLLETDPEVWRRVEIPGDFTISQFGRAVVRSVGWRGNQWYLFRDPDGKEVVDPFQNQWFMGLDPTVDVEGSKAEEKDASKIRVSEMFSMEKKRSMLEMGSDGWLHLIELEGIKDPEGRKHYPKCTDGASACPPEDCGGSDRYEDMMKAVRDPKHPDHEDMKDWLEGQGQGYKKFNPKKFKPADIHFYDYEDRDLNDV
jgi:hypothetical protein